MSTRDDGGDLLRRAGSASPSDVSSVPDDEQSDGSAISAKSSVGSPRSDVGRRDSSGQLRRKSSAYLGRKKMSQLSPRLSSALGKRGSNEQRRRSMGAAKLALDEDSYEDIPKNNRQAIEQYLSDSRLLRPTSKAGRKIQRDASLESSTMDSDEEIDLMFGDGTDAASNDPKRGDGDGDGDDNATDKANGGDAAALRPRLTLKRLLRENNDTEDDDLFLNVRNSVRFVNLRRMRRKGWLSLWGFLIFAGVFLVMLNLWYDIGTLSKTQRAFNQFFSDIEFAPGRGPEYVRSTPDLWDYLRSVVNRIYTNKEYGYVPTPTSRGHVMRHTKVLNSFSVIKSSVKTVDCDPPKWSKGHSPIFHTTKCYRMAGSWLGKKNIGSDLLTLDLSEGMTAVLAKIDQAELDNFIDDATTEVKIQFWFYNPQTRYTSRLRAIFGFNVFGVVEYTGLRIFPIRLFPYESSKDYFVMGCQAFYMLVLVKFLFTALRKMYRTIKATGAVVAGMIAYWTSLWTVIDWLTCALGITGISFHFYYIRAGGRDNLLQNSSADFGSEWIPDLSRYTLGLAAMFYSWKTLHYFDFEPRVAMLIKTLELAWPTLTFYAASLMVIMTGYAIGGHMIVGGTGIVEFSTFGTSFQSCLRMTTGEITLGTIWPEDASHPATKAAVSIFYWTYVLLVFFILLNMFIAIILDSYNLCMEQSRLGAADHKNLLLFFLDGVRVVKEEFLSLLLCRPNGRIPKIAEDHAYVVLGTYNNEGHYLVRSSELQKHLKDTPGGHEIVSWLKYLQTKASQDAMANAMLRNEAYAALGTRPRNGP